MNYETGFQLGVMEARLKKMRKQRDACKKQRDELIVDIAKLRERNEELENMWRTVKMNCLEDTNFTVLDLTNYRLRVERTRQ